ncbi:hypothetical protein ACS0X5_16865 [Burkholderia gladioli]|uniref:hypothetical protein n=1 Tax=Burkholderia gladioli TaxID=28095 RepID=UPI003D55F83B
MEKSSLRLVERAAANGWLGAADQFILISGINRGRTSFTTAGIHMDFLKRR